MEPDLLLPILLAVRDRPALLPLHKLVSLLARASPEVFQRLMSDERIRGSASACLAARLAAASEPILGKRGRTCWAPDEALETAAEDVLPGTPSASAARDAAASASPRCLDASFSEFGEGEPHLAAHGTSRDHGGLAGCAAGIVLTPPLTSFFRTKAIVYQNIMHRKGQLVNKGHRYGKVLFDCSDGNEASLCPPPGFSTPKWGGGAAGGALSLSPLTSKSPATRAWMVEMLPFQGPDTSVLNRKRICSCTMRPACGIAAELVQGSFRALLASPQGHPGGGGGGGDSGGGRCCSDVLEELQGPLAELQQCDPGAGGQDAKLCFWLNCFNAGCIIIIIIIILIIIIVMIIMALLLVTTCCVIIVMSIIIIIIIIIITIAIIIIIDIIIIIIIIIISSRRAVRALRPGQRSGGPAIRPRALDRLPPSGRA